MWGSDGDPDGDGSGVYGQRFDSDGNALGDEFLVNSGTTGNQKWPSVAGDADNNFIATWTSTDADSEGVSGRVFSTGDTDGGDEDGGGTDPGSTPATRSIQDITFNTFADAQEAIAIADRALSQLSTMASSIGAVMNRFEGVVRNLSSMHENQSASMGRIMDADIALETADLARLSVMQQASTAVLAQANLQPQLVMQLLG